MGFWKTALTLPLELKLAPLTEIFGSAPDDNQFRYDLYARETMGCHQCGGLLGYCTVVPCL